MHRHLGPGLLESVYQRALVHELNLRGFAVKVEVPVTVMYKDLEIFLFVVLVILLVFVASSGATNNADAQANRDN